MQEKDKTISILRNKELEEQKDEKRLSETYEATNRNEVIPCHHESVINITAGSSSSPFQWNRGRRDVQVTRPQRPKSYPYSIGDHNVVGIEEDVQKLVQQLIDPHCDNHFAIVGMGGSGKTTLVRKIYNHQDICRYFDRRAWICVSQVWSQESILKDIFSQITSQNSNNLSATEIVQQIRNLIGNNSYFVVLDDVWKPDALREIMVPIARPHGSKFVITTRNQNVIQFSDLVFSIHEPRRLTDDQSLELFKKIAFDHIAHTNDHFVDLAKKMLRKCDGLPLAVISLAGLLRRKKTIQEWMKVRDNVSSKIIEDHAGPSDYGRVEDILGLSYSDLNHTLKSCFMYLSLFPEDAEIGCGMLMRCWIAEGFFKSVLLPTNETIEDVARQHLDELIQRCLVQIVKENYAEEVKYIRVHDLLRDLAIKKSRAKCFCGTYPSSSLQMSTMLLLRLGINGDKYRDGEKIVEDCLNLKLTPTLNQYNVSRRLRTFIQFNSSFRNFKWSEFDMKILFTNYTLLRVLILYVSGNRIPDAIGSLIHLRYLRLSIYGMYHLPDSIQNLRNLLYFDLRPGGVLKGKLPNLKQMKELRYLSSPWSSTTEEPLNLHHLRKLKVLWGISPGKWMMTELKYLSPTIEKLWIKNIEKSEELEEVYQCPSIVQDNLYLLMLSWKELKEHVRFELQKLQHCTKLQNLCLDGEIAATGVFPPFLLQLQLEESRLNHLDSFADLTLLKVLKLNLNAYVGVDLTFPANSLLNLEKLQLYHLTYLERIHVIEGAMPHLKFFNVQSCRCLRVIHVMEGAMPHLESFHLANCDNLKVLWGKWMMNDLKYLSSRVEKLGIIHIQNSEELDLVYQCPCIVEDNLCALKLKLKTYDTKFELQKLQHCSKLSKLYLEGEIATGVPLVFPPYLLKLELKWSRLDGQESFADALKRLPYLKFLKLAYDAYVSVDLTFAAISLLKLEKLQLYHLTNVERIHVMERAMPNLKSFEVGLCKKLEIPQCLWHLVRRIDDDEEVDEDDMFVSDEDEVDTELKL